MTTGLTNATWEEEVVSEEAYYDDYCEECANNVMLHEFITLVDHYIFYHVVLYYGEINMIDII